MCNQHTDCHIGTQIGRLRWRWEGSTSFFVAGKSCLVVKTTRGSTEKKQPPVPDNFTNPPSVNIFLTTPNVPYITKKTNSPSSLELALHFTSLPWKRLSSNLLILFSANKKNSFTLWRFPKPLELSIGWPVQHFDEVQITSSTNENSPFLSLKPFLIGHCCNQWDIFFSVYKPVR